MQNREVKIRDNDSVRETGKRRQVRTANPSCGGPLQSELRFERENKIRVR
jgi:hypothetical protein